MDFKVIQANSQSTRSSLLLTINGKSYLFNCPDGTQRSMIDINIKFGKVKELFITKSHSSHSLGYYGFCLSRHQQLYGILINHTNVLQPESTGKEIQDNVNIYGTKRLEAVFSDSKGVFIENINDYIKVIPQGCESTTTEAPFFKDENLSIFAIPSAQSNDERLNFLCVPQPKRPVFLPEKAKGLGVRPGKDFGLLSKGVSVFVDGREIRPGDVLGEVSKVRSTLVLHLSAGDDLAGLVESKAVKEYWDTIDLVYYVVEDDSIGGLFSQIAKFISLFPAAMHLIDCLELNDDGPLLTSRFKAFYILSKVTNSGKSTMKEVSSNSTLYDDLKTKLRTLGKVATSQKGLQYDYKAKLSSLFKIEDYKEFLSSTSNIKACSFLSEAKFQNEPEITFLGTISNKPSAYRNVSSIMLKINENFLLLDCGEGSLDQISQLYGSSLHEVLSKLRLICISHKHGDHLYGIMQVLESVDKQISLGKSGGLYLLVPSAVEPWLSSLISSQLKHPKCFPIITCLETSPLETLIYASATTSQDSFKDIPPRPDDEIKALKLKYLEEATSKRGQFIEFCLKEFNTVVYSIEVYHCGDSWGFLLEERQNAWRVAYSGDCLPCNNFRHFTKGATLIIHEATFDDELKEEALRKKHSTIGEAMKLGGSAWRCALTHFSPRYDRALPFEDRYERDKVLISVDGLSLSLGLFEDYYKYYKEYAKLME